MKTVEEIVSLYKDRVDAQGPILRQMREVRQLANGDVVVAGKAPFIQSINMVNIGAELTITNPMVQAWLLNKNRDPYGELWVTNWELDND